MRPVVVTAGAIASASANNIALSQSPAAAGWLVLNGTLSNAVANSIGLSQTITGATAVLLNGALGGAIIVQTGLKGAILTAPQEGATTRPYRPGPSRIYITSAGNDSGITFAIVGLSQNGTAISETLTGANMGVAVSVNLYWSIISITASGSTASTITIGNFRQATLDKPRRVLITTGSAISFTIYGTDWAGAPISETVTNSGASVASVLDYATVTAISNSAAGTTITVGTNGVASSPWVRLDEWAFAQTGLQCTVAGTANYTVQLTYDDPNSLTNPVTPALMTWLNSSDPGVVAASASAPSLFTVSPMYTRVVLNSGSGSVTMTVLQYASATGGPT